MIFIREETMKKLLLTAALLPLGGMAAAQCAPDFTGVTLNVSTQNGPAIASALSAAAEVWEKKTCICPSQSSKA